MADAYLQSLLADSESIRSEARQHPMALIRFALQPILVFLGALILLAIGTWLTPDGQGLFSDIVRWIDTLLGLLTAGMFILAIIWFPIQAFRWTKRRFTVTDRRVLYVDGVLRKNSADAGLSMITDVSFRQGVLGRSLGYGDLVIATASNRPLHFRQIRDALAFKQAIMAAQHATVEARADEILVSKGLAPAAAAVAPVAAAAVVAAPLQPAAVEPAAPVVPAWDGSDVPQMTEDDTPPSDPAIFGAPGTEPPVGATTEAAEAADEAGAAAEAADEAGTVSEGTELASVAVSDGAEAIQGAADAAEEAADPAGEPVQAVADTVADAAEEAGTTAESIRSGGYVAALDDVDSRIGGIGEDAKGSGADSVTSAIARLAELHDSGAITDDEFETRKQELLDRL